MQSITQKLKTLKLDKDNFPLVYVEWEDSIRKNGWLHGDELEDWSKEDSCWVKNVGWLVVKSDEYIVVCASLQKENMDEKEDSQFGCLQKIPNTWIREFKILK